MKMPSAWLASQLKTWSVNIGVSFAEKAKCLQLPFFFCYFFLVRRIIARWTSTYSLLSSSESGKNWKSETLVFGEREQHREPKINTQLFRTLKLAMMLVLGHLPVQFCRLTVLQWVETLVPATRTFRRTERNKAQRTVPAQKKNQFSFVSCQFGWDQELICLQLNVKVTNFKFSVQCMCNGYKHLFKAVNTILFKGFK